MKLNIAKTQNGINIIDSRDNSIVAFENIDVHYTLVTDDITVGEKPNCTPYKDRSCTADKIVFVDDCVILYYENVQSQLKIQDIGNALKFEVQSSSSELSQLSITLPLNFLGKKGTSSQKQYLCNSPYDSEDGDCHAWLFTRADGNNLGLASGDMAGWKIDYSHFLCGHYFMGLKLFANFDRAYSKQRRANKMTFYLFTAQNFEDMLKSSSKLLGQTMLYYDVAGARVGKQIDVKVFGDSLTVCASDSMGEREVEVIGGIAKVTLLNAGRTKVVAKGDSGLKSDCFLYAYNSIDELFELSMDAVSKVDLAKTDGNLCEHQCWLSAMLRFMNKNSTRKYEQKTREMLSLIMCDDEAKAIPRLSILSKACGEVPPYHIYKSTRLQEQFFGVTILHDAYRLYGERKFLDYAVNTLNTLIDNYVLDSGQIERVDYAHEDYSTVTAPMIPIVDMARLMGELKMFELQSKYLECAKKLVEYLFDRGFNFPTEGGKTDEVQPEIEEGSLSCTALSLLYFCDNIEYNHKYIDRAKELLNYHDSWVMSSPHPCQYGSTLRWWETCWEGDADGPALCAGHAWTIWRAEADFLYGKLCGSNVHLRKAYNGFMSNFSKIESDGKSYAIFQPDMIPGGGLTRNTADINFKLKRGFPTNHDSGLSRYVWVRTCETYFKHKIDEKYIF